MTMTTRKRIAIAIGSIAAVVLLVLPAIALIVLKSIDFNRYKSVLQKQVAQSSGRTLSIGGDIELDIGVRSRLAVSDINLSNVSWGSRQTMIAIERAEAEVDLLPLIFGNVHIHRLLLVKPDILLETNDRGENNWQLQRADDSDGGEQETEGQNRSLPRIHHLVITDVNFTYRDGASASQTRLLMERIEAETESGNRGLLLQVNGHINRQPLELSAQLDSFKPHAAAVEPSVAQRSGTIRVAIAYGNASHETDKKPGKLKATIAGELVVTPSTYTLDTLQLTLNDNRFTGRVDYVLAEEKPILDAELNFATLDLRKFLQKAETSPSPKKAAKERKVFSAENFDLSILDSINAKITVSGEKILADHLAISQLTLTAVLTDGQLTIKPFSFGIGDGALHNTLVLDNRGNIPQLSLSSRGGGFNLGEVLKKADSTDLLVGAPVTMDISLQSRGESPAALAGSLSGQILVDIGAGQIGNQYLNLVGADLTAQLLRALNPFSQQKAAYTQLECAVVNLNVREGIIQYDKKIAAKTDKMTIISSGIIDLKKETLAIGIVPKPRKDTKGLGLGAGSLVSTAQLEGTLANPQLGINAANTAKTGAKIYGALVTGGASLLLEGLVSKLVADPHPCKTAKNSTTATAKPSKKSKFKQLLGF